MTGGTEATAIGERYHSGPEPGPPVYVPTAKRGGTESRSWSPDGAFRSDLLSAIPALYPFAMSLCGDAATSDDLVQEALVRAWAKGHQFQPGSNMVAWLCTILRNQFYTAMRRRMREVEDIDGEFAGTLAEPPSQEGVVALKALHDAMQALPPGQREALLMVGTEGLTYEEVAERLGCQVGTVKSRISRARCRLAGTP